LLAKRFTEERVVRVDAPAAHEPQREPAPTALAKPKAPPPLPPDARLSRVTPPPLPAFGLPVAVQRVAVECVAVERVAVERVAVEIAPTMARRAREEEIPDFLNGAVRRRRVLWLVSAVAGLALLAAIVAAVASHYRPI
jgi:hypothetical protein